MEKFDLSPLYRSIIGLDRMAGMFDTMVEQPAGGFPPYNVEKVGDDNYRISLAVAGFNEDDIEVVLEKQQLRIAGKIANEKPEVERTFLHQGIAERAFERRFNLSEDIKVVGAYMDRGLLHIDLQRIVPEEKKPRRIKIANSDNQAVAKTAPSPSLAAS